MRYIVATLAALFITMSGCAGLGVKVCIDPPDKVMEFVSTGDVERAVCVQAGSGFDTPRPITLPELKEVK